MELPKLGAMEFTREEFSTMVARLAILGYEIQRKSDYDIGEGCLGTGVLLLASFALQNDLLDTDAFLKELNRCPFARPREITIALLKELEINFKVKSPEKKGKAV